MNVRQKPADNRRSECIDSYRQQREPREVHSISSSEADQHHYQYQPLVQHQYHRREQGHINRGRALANHESEYKLRIVLPAFNGQMHIEAFLNWISEV